MQRPIESGRLEFPSAPLACENRGSGRSHRRFTCSYLRWRTSSTPSHRNTSGTSKLDPPTGWSYTVARLSQSMTSLLKFECWLPFASGCLAFVAVMTLVEIARAEVTATGAFSTSVPITVPEYFGITPQLALSYISNAGVGDAGRGWLLTGLSGIGRGSPN